MAWVYLFDERNGVSIVNGMSIVNVDTISSISPCDKELKLMYNLAAHAPFSLVNAGESTLIVLGAPDEVMLNIVDQCGSLGDLADSYTKRVDIVLYRRARRMEELTKRVDELEELAKTKGGNK